MIHGNSSELIPCFGLISADFQNKVFFQTLSQQYMNLIESFFGVVIFNKGQLQRKYKLSSYERALKMLKNAEHYNLPSLAFCYRGKLGMSSKLTLPPPLTGICPPKIFKKQ